MARISAKERVANFARSEFDALYARKQTRKLRQAVDLLFAASAEELNRVVRDRAKVRG